ncbi:hypothetical protein C8R48DRAFT_673782 [Suillus tomentosus]|nr:hypothetical protein C8R48DRAFT_673782 [Suillus tomentosus]
MSELEASLYALYCNNSMSVAVITMISYEYNPELTRYAGKTAVRYFGILVVMFSATSLGGGLVYIPEALLWHVSVYAMGYLCILLLDESGGCIFVESTLSYLK